MAKFEPHEKVILLTELDIFKCLEYGQTGANIHRCMRSYKCVKAPFFKMKGKLLDDIMLKFCLRRLLLIVG